MNESEITDLHNRRGNIGVVARECQAHCYPLLAWPEDRHLLRLADLPRFTRANVRRAWVSCAVNTVFTAINDESLRSGLVEGRAYAITGEAAQGQVKLVTEYLITTK